MSPRELHARILAEWAKGKFASEIAAELGLPESKVSGVVKRGPETARTEHYRNKALREPRLTMGPQALDREAAVLSLWADGASASAIARDLGFVSRSVTIGIVSRSKGAAAEAAKRAHAAMVGQRPPGLHGPARSHHAKPAAPSAKRERHALTAQELAEHRAKCMAVQRAAIARVELTLVDNQAFVKVEREPDFYAHMRTDRGLSDALAALTRDRKTGEIFHGSA